MVGGGLAPDAGSDGKKHKPPPLGVQFKFPEVMRHDGQEVYFGSHRCTPEAVDMHIQGVKGPHLLVGEEGGRLHLLLRSRLSVREAYPEGASNSKTCFVIFFMIILCIEII